MTENPTPNQDKKNQKNNTSQKNYQKNYPQKNHSPNQREKSKHNKNPRPNKPQGTNSKIQSNYTYTEQEWIKAMNTRGISVEKYYCHPLSQPQKESPLKAKEHRENKPPPPQVQKEKTQA